MMLLLLLDCMNEFVARVWWAPMGKGPKEAMGKAPKKSTRTAPSAMAAGTVVVLAFALGVGVTGRFCVADIGSTLQPLQSALCREALCSSGSSSGSSGRGRSASGSGSGRGGSTGTDRGGAQPLENPWRHTTHPTMAQDGWNWTQLSMSRSGNFPATGVKQLTAQEVREKGAMWVWHTTFARSIPAVVQGLAAEYRHMADWTFDDYRREWGSNKVVVAFSDHPNFNRGQADPTYGRLVMHPDRVQMPFDEYLDLASNPHPGEHLAVQQSPSRDFSEFGLPSLPPLLDELVKYTLNARNFWAATPPKVSVLHYDWQDSVLMQISGSKRFTIIDPARLNTAYPCVAYLSQLKRVAPGIFERRLTSRELDNFPLLNVSHPDLERHPLAAESHKIVVDLEPGDALLLPAYWYHQVDSFAPPGRLNVAVNYWFQGHSLATRLYRTLRENLFINCTEKMPAGVAHPCRD